MGFSDLFLEVTKLFCSYEGIEIDYTRKLDDRLDINLRISDPKSIVRFQHFCSDANVYSHCYTTSFVEDDESIGESLRRLVWFFSFPCEKNDDGLPEKLKDYCCHMVWDLQKRGKLSKPESNRLLSLFGGAQRVP